MIALMFLMVCAIFILYFSGKFIRRNSISNSHISECVSNFKNGISTVKIDGKTYHGKGNVVINDNILTIGNEIIPLENNTSILIYGNVEGNITSKESITVNGDVSGEVIGHDITCDDIGGNATADGDVTCDDIGGNATAGGDITCDDIGGNVTSDGDVTCDTINGTLNIGV